MISDNQIHIMMMLHYWLVKQTILLSLGFYLHRIPKFIKWISPEFYWPKPITDKVIYLTFDDGPTSDITQFVLEELQKWNAKATFFCLGERIELNREIFDGIIAKGHLIGNHTYSHLDGWKNKPPLYEKDILRCQETIESTTKNEKKYFRPPYGRITKSQMKYLKRTFNLVLWDYMVGDFDHQLSKVKCLQRALKNIKNGDIVVLHDNQKSKKTLTFLLPKLLTHFSNEGFRFDTL